MTRVRASRKKKQYELKHRSGRRRSRGQPSGAEEWGSGGLIRNDPQRRGLGKEIFVVVQTRESVGTSVNSWMEERFRRQKR